MKNIDSIQLVNFEKFTINIHGWFKLDPSSFVMLLILSWEAAIEVTRTKLDVTDLNLLLMLRFLWIRGGKQEQFFIMSEKITNTYMIMINQKHMNFKSWL